MQMSIAQIVITRRALSETGEFHPDGKPVAKTYAGKELSAYMWFNKNTEEIMEGYQKVLTESQEKVEKKYKKELEDEKKAMNNFKTILQQIAMDAKGDERKERDKNILEKAMEMMGKASIRFKVDMELNQDKELLKSFKEDKHDVEIKDNTMELIKERFDNYQFSTNDVEVAELIEKIYG